MQNPKGFRVYSSKHPAPTICTYGAEKYCGPGRHTQFITDKAGIRVMRMEEAARVTGCLPRVVEQFSTIKESLAMRMVGNMVPVEPIGAILDEINGEAVRATWAAHASHWLSTLGCHAVDQESKGKGVNGGCHTMVPL
jgi:hypothetical protein